MSEGHDEVIDGVQILWGLRKLSKARVPHSGGDHSYSFRPSKLASKVLSLFLMIA